MLQLGERGQPLATGGVQSDHYLIEAFKHVYALRTELGDPDFVNNTALDSAIASADFALSLAAMVQVHIPRLDVPCHSLHVCFG